MIRRIIAVLFCLALIGTACSKKDAGTDAAKGNTFAVQVDAKKAGQPFNFFSLEYFPASISVHPGDTVEFINNFSGEPHSVTFGTLVEAGLAKAKPADTTENADLKKLPTMIPDDPTAPIPQNAMGPCYLATGEPTGTAACTADQQRQPEFDGKYSYFNSGFLSPDMKSFKVKFASAIPAGTYSYFCLLHRAAMSGKIAVVAASQTVPSPKEVDVTSKADIDGVVAYLQPVFSGAKPAAGTVASGLGLPDKPGLIAEFAPKEISIPVGGKVTWDILGPHTVTFNPPADAGSPLTKNPDGTTTTNGKVFAPAGGPGFQGQPGTKTTVDAGSWDGDGFHNSGFLPGFGPPGSLLYSIKFTKAGSFVYSCIIHPGMVGTVKVA